MCTYLRVCLCMFVIILLYFCFVIPLHLSSCKAGVLQCQSVPGCHVDGGWSQWGAWTECSLPCGGGVKYRRRQCDNPSPQSGGRGCLGVGEQRKDCNIHLCTGSTVWPIKFRDEFVDLNTTLNKVSQLYQNVMERLICYVTHP